MARATGCISTGAPLWEGTRSARIWVAAAVSSAPCLCPSPNSSGQAPQIPLTASVRQDFHGPPTRHPATLGGLDVYPGLSSSLWRNHRPREALLGPRQHGKGRCVSVASALTLVGQPSQSPCFLGRGRGVLFCCTPVFWDLCSGVCLWVAAHSSCGRDWGQGWAVAILKTSLPTTKPSCQKLNRIL